MSVRRTTPPDPNVRETEGPDTHQNAGAHGFQQRGHHDSGRPAKRSVAHEQLPQRKTIKGKPRPVAQARLGTFTLRLSPKA